MSSTASSVPLRTGLSIAGLIVVLDQASKMVALDRLFETGNVVQVTSFLNLVAVWNRGVSFGMFASEAEIMPWILAGMALAVSLVLAIWLARSETKALMYGLGLIIGGAVGNVVDRVRFGAVIDFVDAHIAGYHWPAFNLADSAITIGVILLLLDGFVGNRSEPD